MTERTRPDTFDVYCYACGSPLAIDQTAEEIAARDPSAACRYCHRTVTYSIRSADRLDARKLREDLASPQMPEEAFTPTWEPPAPPAEPATTTSDAVVDGVTLNFDLYFRHGDFMGRVQREEPPGPVEGGGGLDVRSALYMSRLGQRYAERLRADIQPVAPGVTLEFQARTPDEVGGPGVDYDVVRTLFEVGALGFAAYTGAKEFGRDILRVVDKIKELAAPDPDGGPGVIIPSGIAWLVAARAFEERGETDLELILDAPLVKIGLYPPVTYGYVVMFRAGKRILVAMVSARGDVASVGEVPSPVIDWPDMPMEIPPDW